MEMRDLRAEVVGIAERQASLTDDELLEFLEYELERAGLALADRGPGTTLREYATNFWPGPSASRRLSASSPR